MAKSVDEETYGEREEHDPDAVRNGNPGKPQSEYETADPVVTDDPSEFKPEVGRGRSRVDPQARLNQRAVIAIAFDDLSCQPRRRSESKNGDQ